MHALKLTQIGNSMGVILPKETLAKLNIQKGDTLYLTETPGPSITLTAFDRQVAEDIALGEAFMDRYRDTFRALAK
jgi:putative addiction module antidote